MHSSAASRLIQRGLWPPKEGSDSSGLWSGLIGVANPPTYSTLVPILDPKKSSASLCRGSIVVVDMAAGSSLEPLVERLGTLRAQHPGCVIVGRLSSETRQDKPRAIPPTSVLRTLLTHVPGAASEWRSVLCSSDLPAEEVGRWLRSLRPDWCVASWLVQGIIANGESARSWLREQSFPVSWARAVLKRSGLGSISAWIRHRRGLDVVQRIQRHPDWTFDRVAYRCGYAQAAQINHLLGRLYRVTPSEVRRTIGWEWLLARALRSALRQVPIQAPDRRFVHMPDCSATTRRTPSPAKED